jgi:hypothetical protein
MSIWDASPTRLTLRPNPEELDELFTAARNSQRMQVGKGLMSPRTGGPLSVQLDPIHSNPHSIRQAFMGVIVQQGPPDNLGVQGDDFTDARYWVREMLETSIDQSTLNARPRWTKKNNFWNAFSDTPPTTLSDYGVWVAAYNLSEADLLEPGDETHNLPVDGSRLVHVFATRSPAHALRFYFTSGGSSGGGGENTAFAAVVNIDDPEKQTLHVRQVESVVDENGNPTYSLRVERDENNLPLPADQQRKLVWTWPGTRAKHYAAYLWNMGFINEVTPILPVVRIGGKFYVQQYNRYSLQPRPATVRTTDCKQT